MNRAIDITISLSIAIVLILIFNEVGKHMYIPSFEELDKQGLNGGPVRVNGEVSARQKYYTTEASGKAVVFSITGETLVADVVGAWITIRDDGYTEVGPIFNSPSDDSGPRKNFSFLQVAGHLSKEWPDFIHILSDRGGSGIFVGDRDYSMFDGRTATIVFNDDDKPIALSVTGTHITEEPLPEKDYVYVSDGLGIVTYTFNARFRN